MAPATARDLIASAAAAGSNTSKSPGNGPRCCCCCCSASAQAAGKPAAAAAAAAAVDLASMVLKVGALGADLWPANTLRGMSSTLQQPQQQLHNAVNSQPEGYLDHNRVWLSLRCPIKIQNQKPAYKLKAEHLTYMRNVWTVLSDSLSCTCSFVVYLSLQLHGG